MKQKQIKILILLMSFAIIGLVAIQVYWVKSVLDITNQEFDLTVSDVLRTITKKIEHNETADILVERIKDQKDGILIISDSLSVKANNIVISKKHDVKVNTNFFYEDSLMKNKKMKVEIVRDSSDKRLTVLTRINETKNDTDVFYFTTKDKEESAAWVEDDREVNPLKRVINDLTVLPSREKMIMNLDFEVLNKWMSEELARRGIDTEFLIKIIKEESFQEDSDSDKIIKSESRDYRARLFQNNFIPFGEFISVSFPNKNNFLLRSVSVILGISVILFLIIISVFYRTLKMFLKQKKITEIKNDFINNITHEFKTPLSTIALACETINQPSLISQRDSLIKYLDIIKNENNRIRNMVENILTTAAYDNGEMVLNNSQIELHKIIDGIIEKYTVALTRCNGKIVTKFIAQNNLIYADLFHLQNIISNIIDNSLKYIVKNPVINIDTYNEESKIILSIKDNGIGIKKENLSKVFEPFYRVPTGNVHNVKGQGIGLSYVKKMVEALSGTVEIKSQINVGTTVIITFPQNK